MAKKLVYNYTFNPGASNVGNIVIKGNYPAKVWQLVTDTGTGGLYTHSFTRDEFASTTGAIEIISGGSGDLTISVPGTSLDEDTGIMTVTTTTAHGLSSGATIKFRPMSTTFRCAKDNYTTDHSYPRTTDPIYDTPVAVTVVDSNTFTVMTGRPTGGAISSDNEIIYNFADNKKGGSTYYNSSTDETTLTLKHDTSHLDRLDQLQIFIDIQEDKINFSETFTDPVSKLRVSNPQNLIDTDFEYGLQPTKWETIELVNNIPSFFASSNDYSISDVISVTTTENSENITVTTMEPHGLTVGSPIDVQGLTSRTAEGKYLVTNIISTTQFVYKGKGAQSSTGAINGSYTVIIPGEFYSGSDINIKDEIGIETDGLAPSTLNIETDYHHGFGRGSSLYFTNTIGSRKLTLDETSTDTAPDGRPYVDHEDSLNVTVRNDSSMTETRQMTGYKVLKFHSTAVNTSDNTITWQDHGLEAGDVLLYSAPGSDSPIGGLERFQIYYVKSAPTANTITLCSTSGGNYSGNATINFNSTGTSNYGRHQLILGYEIRYCYKPYYSYTTYFQTRYAYNGSGSGRDMTTYYSNSSGSGYFGMGGVKPQRYLFCRTDGSSLPSDIVYSSGVWYGQGKYSNFQFGNPNLGYNFLEDFQRFNSTNSYYTYSTGNNNFWGHYYNSPGAFYIYYIGGFNYYSSTYEYPGGGDMFFFPLQTDSEADTLYVPNHGFENGGAVTVDTVSGSDIRYRTDTGRSYSTSPSTSTFTSGTTSTVDVQSANRIRIVGANRIHDAAGTYSVTGNATNPLGNSFYYDGHDLVRGEKLTLSTTGTLPSSTSGAVDPGLSTKSLDTVYSAVTGALDNIKTAMGSDSGVLLINNNSKYYPFTSSFSTIDNGYQYFYWYTSRLRLTIYTQGWSTVTSSLSSVNFSSDNRHATGIAWDPFSNTDQAGKGYYHIQTPHAYNQTIPYHVSIFQVPNPANSGGYRTQMYYSRGGYNYQGNGELDYVDNYYSNWFSIAGGWKYTYETNYTRPSSAGSYHGRIHMKVILMNEGWAGHLDWDNSNIYFPSSNYPWSYNYGYGGTRYHIDVMIPIKSGTTTSRYGASGSNKTNAQIASEIATAVANRLTQPALAAGTVFANPINANRFGLQTENDVLYNFTDSGTSPFTFQTEEKTGGLDGYYDVDTVTNTTIGHFSNVELPKRVINLDFNNVVSVTGTVYFNKDNYKMRNLQKVVYTSSGGDIEGLMSGNTYYTVADGPDHFRLASSAENAASGNVVSIATTSAGNFTLTVPSIAGISSAPGTIGISSTKSTITGTETLFKRFFRSGDTIKVSDTNQSPPAYREYEIASVIDDTELTIQGLAGIDIDPTFYYVDTKINTRPDGTFIHRPFDGGVEITAGTSPNSSIVRQTRKYFRYQSGKGIQCSVAINFNPSRIINKIIGVGNSSLPAETYLVNVNNNGNGSYNISGDDRNSRVLGENEPLVISQGDTLKIQINAPGHPLWIKTTQSTGSSNAVTTGITNNGAETGLITWDTTSVTPGTYYYNCQNHATMAAPITVEPVGITTTIATATTKYPHGLTRGDSLTIRGSKDSAYNGTFEIQAADDFTFAYYIPPFFSSIPDGILEYSIDSWSNSAVRCGLFDYQNGMFFEFDGTELACVRRSSVQQLTGTVAVTSNSNIVTGNDTNFTGQLEVGDFVVIRGSSYRITNLASKTEMHIQPAYRGIDSGGVILTKTIDTRVVQSEWNIDKADGSGPSGFVLDITKIQMAYIDYSWYGAGKIRFGFKDAKGHVKYMHEFLHNNILEEAYMRSGNIPGRYEIENTSDVLPTYVPSLFHWGTSVIMDGKFDDDKAYLFTASSNSLSFTNGDSETATTTGASTTVRYYDYSQRRYNWYTRIPFANSDAGKFSSGTPLYTADESLNGELVDYISYSGNTIYVHIFIGTSRSWYQGPAVYPTADSGEVVNIGAPASGGDEVNLQEQVPLISIRLAPSVDNNLTGSLGQREIINRMQLQLKQLGITLSHDCTVNLILNGAISNRTYENVTSPSLSELVTHVAGDKVIGGTTIFSLRASGGTENAAGKRLSATNDFDISQITDLGNSIIGGDGTFPNGPDILTIAILPIDTGEVNATSPLAVSARITWTESQA